jgi:hypothetical protein
MTTDDRWQEQAEADADVRARLQAYADAALAPDPAATALARATIVAEARRRGPAAGPRSAAGLPEPAPAAGLAGPARVAGPPPVAGPRFSGRRPSFRLALGPGLLAAALLVLLVGVGGVLASAPGGPLYPLRLWTEELRLPTEPAARVGAQLARLDERLGEAEEAAESGNGDAVAAALEAYRSEVEDTVGAAAGDATMRAEVASRLGIHRAVLAALAGRLPARATEAILANLARTEAKILEALGATPPPGVPGGPADTARPEKSPPGKPEATPSGRPTAPEATPTSKPGKTPPGKPEETPKPGKSPPGKSASPTP